MRISDWSSDVCSSDRLVRFRARKAAPERSAGAARSRVRQAFHASTPCPRRATNSSFAITERPSERVRQTRGVIAQRLVDLLPGQSKSPAKIGTPDICTMEPCHAEISSPKVGRSEEHTSELQSLMPSSKAVFFL